MLTDKSITNGFYGYDNNLHVFAGDEYVVDPEDTVVDFPEVWGKIKSSPVIENFQISSVLSLNDKTYVIGKTSSNAYSYVVYTGNAVFPDSIVPTPITNDNAFITARLNEISSETWVAEQWDIFANAFPFEVIDVFKFKDDYIISGMVRYQTSYTQGIPFFLDFGSIYSYETKKRYTRVTQAVADNHEE